MKLTYATDFDITNINNWSGLGYYYGIMLKNAGFDLNYMNNINIPFQSIHLIKERVMKKVMGQIYSPRFNVHASKMYAQIIEKKMDAGMTIISPNTVLLANLNNNSKRILYADATFERLLNLYPNYSRLSGKNIIDGHEVDRQAIQNCNLLIYSSKWAADSAINYYHADPDKVFISPFGANLTMVPALCDIRNIIKKRLANDEIHLLFLGVDWKRKGGDKAKEVAEILNQYGLNTTLHIVGIKDHIPISNCAKIVNHGFIQKGTTAGEEKFAWLLSQCHFLLLPTIADCTPVSFSEANAYGMPCITTNVGGNCCIVQNGINGRIFEPANFTEGAVSFILSIMNSLDSYIQLCFSSYDRYCTELNWSVTGKKIFDMVNAL